MKDRLESLTILASVFLWQGFLSAHDEIKQVNIIVEYIEVEGSLYHDWMFSNRLNGDGTALRKQAQEWVRSDVATIIETVLVPARSGQRAKAESIREKLYPTEPGVPEIPSSVDLDGESGSKLLVRNVPSAFETRNVGTTVEVDPVLGADDITIDLNLSPEIVRQNGVLDWPPENPLPDFTVSLPRFYAMKTTTQVTLRHSRYAFLGSHRPLRPAVKDRKKPIVLLFVRADVARPVSAETKTHSEP